MHFFDITHFSVFTLLFLLSPSKEKRNEIIILNGTQNIAKFSRTSTDCGCHCLRRYFKFICLHIKDFEYPILHYAQCLKTVADLLSKCYQKQIYKYNTTFFKKIQN